MAEYRVSPWTRQDGKEYLSVQKINGERVKRFAVPLEDWDKFREVVDHAPATSTTQLPVEQR